MIPPSSDESLGKEWEGLAIHVGPKIEDAREAASGGEVFGSRAIIVLAFVVAQQRSSCLS